jgi:hypothetical protein
MIGMNNTNAMEPNNIGAMQQPQAMALAEGEPQQNLSNVLASQSEILEQVKNDQQNLQRKLDDVIHHGLERMTAAQLDQQAKEYHQENQRDRDIIRTEMQQEMDHVIDVVHATHSKVMDSTTGNMQHFSSAIEGLSNMMKDQQENMIMGFQAAIQGMNQAITDTLTKATKQSDQEPSASDKRFESNNPEDNHLRQPSATRPKTAKKTKRQRNFSSSSSEESDCEMGLSDSEDERTNVRSSNLVARNSHSHQGGHRGNIPPFL